MRRILRFVPIALAAVLASAAFAATASAPVDTVALAEQVRATERAFAETMARRDHAAFAKFIAEDAIFLSGPTPLHGKQAVVDFWKKLYEKPQAPFSWEPGTVEVLPDGKLALSTGPVHDPAGKLTGTFTSVWRQDSPGVWHIVFDKGDDACEAK